MSAVLDHVMAAISPASPAHAEGARLKLAECNLPHLEAVGMAIAAAQHTARLRATKPMLLIVAADHGIADPGVDFGAQHPTTVAVNAITDGSAAVCHLARNANTSIVVVNAGMAHVPRNNSALVSLAAGNTAAFTVDTPALSRVDVALAIEAGIALALSLKDAGCDLLGLGTLGLGAAEATAALAGAQLGDAIALPARDHDLQPFVSLGALLQASAPTPLQLLAHLGGRDTAVLVGVLLACASLNLPVVLDDNSTVAAAAIATALAPACVGSFIAAHPGRGASPALLQAMHCSPVFTHALGNGEGSAAAMVLALARAAAELTHR
jgi:nicotinate-nucleotide--dimethylbenzimidazole phosphoribosyltransferase